MAQNNVRATLILRNDLAAIWASRNPILAKGELGAEIDTGLLKIGDGVKHFNELSYINNHSAEDGALITAVNNKLTVADYGKSYWKYDANEDTEVKVTETDLTKWPSAVELQVKNGVARWVESKINYDPFRGTIDGALITLQRDPIASNEASTKAYVDSTIATQIANINYLKREIVTELPTSNLDTNTIYMIKDNNAANPDQYKEYMVIDGVLTQIGDTSIDLTNYLQKPEIGNFTEGHLPVFSSDGSIIDSGVLASDINKLSIATTTVLGGVYSSNLDNKVSVDALGIMEVNRIATDKLFVPDGNELILNGGVA